MQFKKKAVKTEIIWSQINKSSITNHISTFMWFFIWLRVYDDNLPLEQPFHMTWILYILELLLKFKCSVDLLSPFSSENIYTNAVKAYSMCLNVNSAHFHLEHFLQNCLLVLRFFFICSVTNCSWVFLFHYSTTLLFVITYCFTPGVWLWLILM